jgi:hypothetical protein
MNLPKFDYHPLKWELKKLKIRLWQLSKILGVSSSKISNSLNGVIPFEIELKNNIQKIADHTREEMIKKEINLIDKFLSNS